jgi:hypothetical protein
LTLPPRPRTFVAMLAASIVVADAPVYSISRDRLFAAIGACGKARGWGCVWYCGRRESFPLGQVGAPAPTCALQNLECQGLHEEKY